MSSTALIFGATGAVGKQLLIDLLKNGKYEKVVSVGRREVELDSSISQERLVQKKIDFENLDNHRNVFKNVSDVYCCLGTTRNDAGSAEKFIKIDQEYVLQSAKVIAEENKTNESNISNVHYLYCSSLGADKNSSFLYPKTKGQTEEALKEMGFERVTVFRPGVLEVEEPRSKFRMGEYFAIHAFRPFNSLFNLQKINPVGNVARAMHRVAQDTSIKPLDPNAIKTAAYGTRAFTFISTDIEAIGNPNK